MSGPFWVCDSDGNEVEGADSLDSAIRLAARFCLDVWPDFERAHVKEVVVVHGHLRDVTRLYVERAGPKGTRKVRITVHGAEWLAWEVNIE